MEYRGRVCKSTMWSDEPIGVNEILCGIWYELWAVGVDRWFD